MYLRFIPFVDSLVSNCILLTYIDCTQSDWNNGAIQNLYKTTNWGSTWTNTLNATGTMNPCLFANILNCFNAGNNENCYSASISVAGQGWYDNVVAVDPTNTNTVWLGGVDMFKSTDGGKNFYLASSWWTSGSAYMHADQHAIVFSPNYATDSTIFFGNDGGVP